jgi:hypothetical protein
MRKDRWTNRHDETKSVLSEDAFWKSLSMIGSQTSGVTALCLQMYSKRYGPVPSNVQLTVRPCAFKCTVNGTALCLQMYSKRYGPVPSNPKQTVTFLGLHDTNDSKMHSV